MKRAHLVGSESESTDEASPDERFSLDTVIEEEGNNLSVGRESESGALQRSNRSSADLFSPLIDFYRKIPRLPRSSSGPRRSSHSRAGRSDW